MPPRYEMTTAANVTNAAMAGMRTCDSPVKRNAVMIANTSVPVIASSQARRWTMVNPSVLQCGGDGRQQAIHLGDVMVDAKPETQAAITPVDDDMVVLQPLVEGGGVIHLEGEEVAARHAGRRHEVAGSKSLQAEPQQPVEEMLLQHRRMTMDRGGIDARGDEHVHRGVEAIDAARIEGRAPEAHRAGCVRDGLARAGRERVERGEPSRVHGAQVATRRYREVARAFARHGVLVSAAEIERALVDAREVDRQCAQRVIAIDAHERIRGSGIADGIEVRRDERRIEEDMRKPHHVPAAAALRRDETLDEG